MCHLTKGSNIYVAIKCSGTGFYKQVFKFFFFKDVGYKDREENNVKGVKQIGGQY